MSESTPTRTEISDEIDALFQLTVQPATSAGESVDVITEAAGEVAAADPFAGLALDDVPLPASDDARATAIAMPISPDLTLAPADDGPAVDGGNSIALDDSTVTTETPDVANAVAADEDPFQGLNLDASQSASEPAAALEPHPADPFAVAPNVDSAPMPAADPFAAPVETPTPTAAPVETPVLAGSDPFAPAAPGASTAPVTTSVQDPFVPQVVADADPFSPAGTGPPVTPVSAPAAAADPLGAAMAAPAVMADPFAVTAPDPFAAPVAAADPFAAPAAAPDPFAAPVAAPAPAPVAAADPFATPVTAPDPFAAPAPAPVAAPDPFAAPAPAPVAAADPFAAPVAAPVAAPDPFAAPMAAADPFAAPAPAPVAAPDPFAAPAPAPVAAADPFAAPMAASVAADDPFAAPVAAPVAAPDPFAAPVAAPDPFAAPAPVAAPDPFAAPAPAPVAAADPFAAPVAAPVAAPDPFAAPMAAADPFAAPVDSFSAPNPASAAPDGAPDPFALGTTPMADPFAMPGVAEDEGAAGIPIPPAAPLANMEGADAPFGGIGSADIDPFAAPPVAPAGAQSVDLDPFATLPGATENIEAHDATTPTAEFAHLAGSSSGVADDAETVAVDLVWAIGIVDTGAGEALTMQRGEIEMLESAQQGDKKRKKGAVKVDKFPFDIVQPGNSIIMTITSPKGGVGKSTTSLAMGALLAESGRVMFERGDITRMPRILVFDGDVANGNLAIRVANKMSPNLYDLIEYCDRTGGAPSVYTSDDMSQAAMLDFVLHHGGLPNLNILAAPENPEAFNDYTVEDYERVLSILQQFYDVIIIDSGTEVVMPSNQVWLRYAHQVFLLTVPERAALNSAGKYARLVTRASKDRPVLVTADKFNVVMMQADADLGFKPEYAISTTFPWASPDHVFYFADFYREAARANNRQSFLSLEDPDYAREITKLAKAAFKNYGEMQRAGR